MKPANLQRWTCLRRATFTTYTWGAMLEDLPHSSLLSVFLASFRKFKLSLAPLEIHAVTAIANVPLDTSKRNRHSRDGAQKERNNDGDSRESDCAYLCKTSDISFLSMPSHDVKYTNLSLALNACLSTIRKFEYISHAVIW